MGTTVAGNVGVLAVNLVTGMLSARLLAPEGRGTFAAVSIFVVIVALLGESGLSEAATYFTARARDRARSIASTCAVMVVGLAALSSALALLIVPYVFAAQPQSTQDLARLAVLATGAVMATELGLGLTAGLGRYNRLAAYRFCQPVVFLVGLVALALADRITASSALAVFLGGYLLAAAVILTPLVLGPGRRRPDRRLGASLAGYGVRLQGKIIGDVGNTRLDLAVLPAVIAAAEIGLYSVAVSVASIVIALFATLGRVLSPMASTGDRTAAMRLVERTTRTVLFAAAACAVVLGMLAPWLVTLVYGRDYAGSVDALRLLLPGAVLWSCCFLLGGGLRAIGRPGSTSLAQLAGLAVTIPGLVLTLPRFGIEGAAATSTAAYFTVFVTMIVSLRRRSPFRARALFDVGALRRDLVWGVDSLRLRTSASRRSPAPAEPSRADGRGTMTAGGGAGSRRSRRGTLRRKDDMPRSTEQRSAWGIGALVIVPALLGALASGLLGLTTVQERYRATGVVQLSEIAGNSPSGQLNPYAADLATALNSAPVNEEVRQALPPGVETGGIEVTRLSDASRVSISLQADTEEQARTALLAGGRAGYLALVEQQAQLLKVRERAALSRLDTLAEYVATARAALDAAPPAGEEAAASVLQQNERLLSIALDDLSRVQGQLAVVEQLRAGAASTTAVAVEAVEPVSRLPQVLPIFAAGFVGGAIPGLALALLLRRRGRDDSGHRASRRSIDPRAQQRAPQAGLRTPEDTATADPEAPDGRREPIGEVRAR